MSAAYLAERQRDSEDLQAAAVVLLAALFLFRAGVRVGRRR